MEIALEVGYEYLVFGREVLPFGFLVWLGSDKIDTLE